MRPSALLSIFLFTACGDDNKGAPSVDAPAGQSIKISGAAKNGLTKATLSGVAITANNTSDDSVVATTTTDADGAYSLTVPFDGTSLDGYVKATLDTYEDTYVFPPAPLTADFDGGAVNMLTPGIVSTLYGAVGVTLDPTAGTISLEAVDTTGKILAGVMVATTPTTTVKYGIPPSPSATATNATDGVASALNAPVGSVTVMATLTGATFHSHSVKVFANGFTTTLVSE